MKAAGQLALVDDSTMRCASFRTPVIAPFNDDKRQSKSTQIDRYQLERANGFVMLWRPIVD
jgi:hypothetical protein